MHEMRAIVENVKELRRRTGAGLRECRDALTATGNDVEAAVIRLRSNPRTPSSSATPVGRIFAGQHQGRIGGMIELRCGTEEVARTDEFQKLGAELLLQVLATGDDGPLLEQPWIRDASRTVCALIAEYAGMVDECITVTRHVRWSL